MKPTQSVDVGFQVRNAPPIAAIAQKIQAGALGKIAAVAGNYNAPAALEKPCAGPSPDEFRLRNWLWYTALSGDILVEQNIHIIDLCNWLLGAHPLKATATGGRNILTHAGDCWDDYQVDYTYPNDVHFAFASTPFSEGNAFNAGLNMFGASGSAALPYSGPVEIVGSQAWEWKNSEAAAAPAKFAANGSFNDNLAFADRDKERTFIESITSGQSHNQIAAGVETALSCMLGRMAGYQKREVTWEELTRPRRNLQARNEPGPIRLDEPSEFRFQTRLDGCPMFAPAYIGRKRFFQMLLFPASTRVLLDSFLPLIAVSLEGVLRPFFVPSYTGPDPDFLHAAPARFACAAFYKESRMKLQSTKLDRKSRGNMGHPSRMLVPRPQLVTRCAAPAWDQ